jgi:7-carboxy-7-deazaguanine synthase
MFGTNEQVGRAFFKNIGHKLLVTSIFPTIQGEGPFMGLPAIFVRLSKCQLACDFCDTFFDHGDEFTQANLLAEINRLREKYTLATEARIGLVFTGGEPSLQTNLVPLLRECCQQNFTFVQIESNGILLLDDMPHRTTLVVSPKCINDRYQTLSDKVLRRADCLKFVVSADPMSAYHEVPSWARTWARDTHKDVFVSPMNVYKRLPEKAERLRRGEAVPDIHKRSEEDERVSAWEPGLLDMEKIQANHEYAGRYAFEHGLRLNLQMHLFANMA